MQNRTDTSEDFQSTPEHPENLPPLSGKQQQRDMSQLTAAAFQPLRQAVTRHPLQFALGLAGLGLTLALLARRRAR